MKSVNLKIGRMQAAAAVALMVVAGAASAQAVTSGGATLPQVLYQDIFTNGLVSGTWSYLGTGSGTGKTAFLTNNASLLGQTGTVHIVGSDSALSSTEYSTYLAAYNNGAASTVANYGRLAQIPAVATAVLVPYTETNVTKLNLTTEQICRIFSNDPAALTWSQVTTAADDGAVGSGSTIQVVYRSETSGTTELFSRFLNAACGPYLPSGKSFTVSNNFKTVVSSALPTLSSTNPDGLPAAWVSATGSAGVLTAMGSDHRLSYLTPEGTYLGDNNAKVARINGFLPDDAAIQSALPAPPAAGVARNNPLNWVPAYTYNASFYPIYGTTNLILGQCYAGGSAAGTAAAAVKEFVTKLNDGTYDTKITTHNFVKLPPAWNTAIKEAFLTAGSTLELNSTSICANIGR